jgi:NAD(P)-dependent dehydrogenase (short-subunit alcohol dehydrogenase family)
MDGGNPQDSQGKEHALRYLVTGANRGIGLELTRQLLDRGDEVLATARRPEAAVALQDLNRAHGDRLTVLALDVGDPDSVAALRRGVERDTIDVLVNNAGIGAETGRLGELDHEALRHVFEIDAVGPLRVIEAVLPALLRGVTRKIVNVTSKMGSIGDNGSGGAYGYRMAKVALNMATRSVARDLAGEGVIAFVVHPGWVKTDMGGPHALITTGQSVAAMLRVIDGAGPEESGRFWEWNGKEIPW